MKALVTGGAGFIGSNLVDRLVEEGHQVVVIDNLSTGKEENLEKSKGSIQFIKGDITNGVELYNAMEGVDVVFHLAAINSVPRSIENPSATHKANTSGTMRLIGIAERLRVKRIVFSSSSSVYGPQASLPTPEASILYPVSPYAVSKATGEMLLKCSSALGGPESVILRFFNVYGPRQDPHSHYSAVIPKFINAALTNQQAVIFGNGEQVRAFTYVDDVVAACMKAAQVEEAAGHTFNVSGVAPISVNELHETIRAVVGVKGIDPLKTPARAGDIQRSFGATGKAMEILRHAPTTTIREGIEKTVAWYKEAEWIGA